MNPYLQSIALAACAAAALPASASCYSMLGANGRVVYQSATAPVDLSRPLHETVPARFPGLQLVFSPHDGACPEIQPLPKSRAGDLPEGITRSGQATVVSRAKPAGNAPINLDNFFNNPNAASYGGTSSR